MTQQVESLLADGGAVGIVGLLGVLFFSSVAFTVVESAMAVIFRHRALTQQQRRVLVSALLPYVFVVLIGVGLLLVTVIGGALRMVRTVHVFGGTWPAAGLSDAVLYLLDMVGHVLLLTALYVVLPVGRVRLGHALIGGITATLLWELTRHVLVWYFARLSMANLIYGSMAAVIVVLLTLEAAAAIFLLGAEVIAEIDRARWPSRKSAGAAPD
jgi:membrane protein